MSLAWRMGGKIDGDIYAVFDASKSPKLCLTSAISRCKVVAIDFFLSHRYFWNFFPSPDSEHMAETRVCNAFSFVLALASWAAVAAMKLRSDSSPVFAF